MISLNATLFIQVVNFLLLMWILNRLLFGPIVRAIEEREEKIRRLLKNTEEISSQAQGVKEDYEKKMKQAHVKAFEAKEKVRTEGVEEAERVVKKALSEAEKSLTETKGVVTLEAERAREEFGSLSQEISREIYLKILGMP
jgi:F-type H+-transporting ATPase subunit b